MTALAPNWISSKQKKTKAAIDQGDGFARIENLLKTMELSLIKKPSSTVNTSDPDPHTKPQTNKLIST